MSELLKLRPPEKQNFSAACEACPDGQVCSGRMSFVRV
jgi:hypothetical protein